MCRCCGSQGRCFPLLCCRRDTLRRCWNHRLCDWHKRIEAKRKEHCCECVYHVLVLHILISVLMSLYGYCAITNWPKPPLALSTSSYRATVMSHGPLARSTDALDSGMKASQRSRQVSTWIRATES